MDDNGNKVDFNNDEILFLDPSTITDKVLSYTGIQFTEFELLEISRGKDSKVAGIYIGRVFPPLIFNKPGTYTNPFDSKKQKTAFKEGVLYFRHGAKSEPANSWDINIIVEREILRRRDLWLENIKKVVEAPLNYNVITIPPNQSISFDNSSPQKVRLSDSPIATPVNISIIEYYKHRRKEVIQEINSRISDREINSYDIESIVKVHDIAQDKELALYMDNMNTTMYSDKFIDWIEDKYKENPALFDEARSKYYSMRYPNQNIRVNN